MSSMTHYMELLATAQPWNLIKFMVVPVVLAEALVAIEFFIVFNRQYHGTLRNISKVLGIIFGIWFLGIFVYLMTTAIPGMPWRGWVDMVAVGFYLSGVIPAVGMALLDLGLVGKNQTPDQKMKTHFILLTMFLIVAHIAMIFGMVNPELIVGSSTKMPM